MLLCLCRGISQLLRSTLSGSQCRGAEGLLFFLWPGLSRCSAARHCHANDSMLSFLFHLCQIAFSLCHLTGSGDAHLFTYMNRPHLPAFISDVCWLIAMSNTLIRSSLTSRQIPRGLYKNPRLHPSPLTRARRLCSQSSGMPSSDYFS